jgi:hypothetical protein
MATWVSNVTVVAFVIMVITLTIDFVVTIFILVTKVAEVPVLTVITKVTMCIGYFCQKYSALQTFPICFLLLVSVLLFSIEV